MKTLFQFMKVGLVCFTAGFPCMRLFEHQQLYIPDRQELTTPQAYQLPYEEIFFMTEDGKKLHGWWIPSANSKAPILLLCHGQGGNISDRLPKALTWHRLGASVFLFDYRGYGKSEGRPSEKGLYLDGHAAYHWASHRFPKSRVFLYGASLGGGVATELAVNHPEATGLILENAFTSIEGMAQHRYANLPVKWLLSNRFDNKEKISQIKIPVMIFHSRSDEVIPYQMGQELYEAAPIPKYFVRLSGPHDEAYSRSGVSYTTPLRRFLEDPESL
jgi:uncharacterized protein